VSMSSRKSHKVKIIIADPKTHGIDNSKCRSMLPDSMLFLQRTTVPVHARRSRHKMDARPSKLQLSLDIS